MSQSWNWSNIRKCKQANSNNEKWHSERTKEKGRQNVKNNSNSLCCHVLNKYTHRQHVVSRIQANGPKRTISRDSLKYIELTLPIIAGEPIFQWHSGQFRGPKDQYGVRIPVKSQSKTSKCWMRIEIRKLKALNVHCTHKSRNQPSQSYNRESQIAIENRRRHTHIHELVYGITEKCPFQRVQLNTITGSRQIDTPTNK